MPPTMSRSRACRFRRARRLRVNGRSITVEDPVPAGHKVAITAISAGENRLRYGQVIGRARMRIEPGRHVHTHNVAFEELVLRLRVS